MGIMSHSNAAATEVAVWFEFKEGQSVHETVALHTPYAGTTLLYQQVNFFPGIVCHAGKHNSWTYLEFLCA